MAWLVSEHRVGVSDLCAMQLDDVMSWADTFADYQKFIKKQAGT